MTSRYSRAQAVEGIGPEGLARLQRSRVAIAGAGNIGGELARHAAMLGIGLLLVDCDTVREENLGTGFSPAHLHLPKVEARRRALQELNPGCPIETLYADIERIGLGALRGVDLILCCLDSRRARAALNELATRLGLPLVDAAIDGTGKSLFARVAAYHPARGSACYLCPYDGAGLEQIRGRKTAERCPSLLGPADADPPTLAISAAGAAAAAAQLVWGLQILLGRGERIIGREMYFDLERGLLSTHALRPNPACALDHRPLTLTPARCPTVEETFRAGEQVLGAEVTLQLHRFSIATELRCPGCGSSRKPARLLEALTAADAECACGSTMQPVGLVDRFGRAEAQEFLSRSWREIGLPDADVLTAASGGAEVHLLLGG